jgi:hypothetical protein
VALAVGHGEDQRHFRYEGFQGKGAVVARLCCLTARLCLLAVGIRRRLSRRHLRLCLRRGAGRLLRIQGGRNSQKGRGSGKDSEGAKNSHVRRSLPILVQVALGGGCCNFQRAQAVEQFR